VPGAGQLDGYRAGLVADLARDSLDQLAQLARLAERITVFLGKHLRGVPLDLLTGTGPDLPVPGYARPVINVTVPIQTLIGVSDHPGQLSGGTLIPAGLARSIAAQPGSTWYRMLTDPAGHLVELSTRGYRPTPPIWRWVVAEWNSCFRPGCDTPATEAECDHKAKHTPGFSIEQAADGSFTLRTRAGFRHRIEAPTHPATEEWPEIQLGIHHCADEILQALQLLRHWREADQAAHADSPELNWEHGLADREYDTPAWALSDELEQIPEPVG
jgi:hypothetical protein